MGISFSNIVENTRTAAVEFENGEVLNVTYKPKAMSPAFFDKLNKELNKGDETDPYAVAHMVCAIVTDWDLLGPLGEDEDGNDLVGKGEPVPVEAQYVAWVPTGILGYIITSVAEDSSPKAKTRKR
ncbi:MAG: hypothetical protein QM753_15945 [Thermomicrobiales bacterium]